MKKEKKKIPDHLIIKHLYEFDRKKEKKKKVDYIFTWFLFLIQSKRRLTISNGISLISSKIIIIISPIDEYTMSGWCSLKNVHIQFNNYNPCYEKEMHYTLVSYNLFHETLRFIGILSYLNKIKHMQLIHYFP